MATMQAIIDRARVLVQDAAKDRYKDPDCLAQLNDAVKEAKRLRPDLFFGQFGTPYADLVLGGTFPLPPEYEPSAIKCLVFWMDAQEDEYSNDGRAGAFMAMWLKELQG